MPKIPSFYTKRLIVRELVETDAPAYQKYFNNYEVIRYLGSTVPWPYPSDGAINYLQKEILPVQGIDQWVWAIALKENPNELIGAIELLRTPSPMNRGFWLAQPYWGRGYMTEATEPVTTFAFELLKFDRLLFGNAVGNSRSGRIKEKSGARFIRREAAEYVDPEFKEREVFELTKADWIQSKTQFI